MKRDADSGQYELWDNLRQRAVALLTSPQGVTALDLSRESTATREAYGQTSFGQSCLLGRRLVEAGVPYVQVNWSRYVEVYYTFSDYGWDTHADNFALLAEWHGPLFDRVLATLVDDLETRGLLETTLLVCMGEFGRTPRINEIGSRDHWHQCYFSLWAGGGVQPGRTIGESDARASIPSAIRSLRPWSGRPCWNTPASTRPPAPSYACFPKDVSSTSYSNVTIDGRIVAAAGPEGKAGVLVLSREGKVLAMIPTPEDPANVEFGGEDGKMLYICAGKSLYRIKTTMTGYRLWPPVSEKWSHDDFNH